MKQRAMDAPEQREMDFDRAARWGLIRQCRLEPLTAGGSRVSVRTLRTVLELLERFGRDGREVWACAETLAEAGNVSTKTVRRAIAALVAESLVLKQRRRCAAGPVVNHYRIVWNELAARCVGAPDDEVPTGPETVPHVVPTPPNSSSPKPPKSPTSAPVAAEQVDCAPGATGLLGPTNWTIRADQLDSKSTNKKRRYENLPSRARAREAAGMRAAPADRPPPGGSRTARPPDPVSANHAGRLRALGVTDAAGTLQAAVASGVSGAALEARLGCAEQVLARSSLRAKLKNPPGAVAWFLVHGAWPVDGLPGPEDQTRAVLAAEQAQQRQAAQAAQQQQAEAQHAALVQARERRWGPILDGLSAAERETLISTAIAAAVRRYVRQQWHVPGVFRDQLLKALAARHAPPEANPDWNPEPNPSPTSPAALEARTNPGAGSP